MRETDRERERERIEVEKKRGRKICQKEKVFLLHARNRRCCRHRRIPRGPLCLLRISSCQRRGHASRGVLELPLGDLSGDAVEEATVEGAAVPFLPVLLLAAAAAARLSLPRSLSLSLSALSPPP